MKILYVIGNGFDRHHDINCSYIDFRDWVVAHNSSFLFHMDEIYGWCDSYWWADFENKLGEINVMEYAQQVAYENTVDLSSDHCDSMWNDAQIEVENQMTELYGNLQSLFEEWVAQLNEPNPDKRVYIDAHDATFMTFNYTRTLEQLYGINPSKVMHIHGVAGIGEKLVVGHGMTYEALRAKYPTPNDLYHAGKLDKETAASFDIHDELAWEEAFNQVASMQKPVEEIMENNESFFESLKGMEKVCVYGFSFSEVDQPYLERIVKLSPNAHWEISYYSIADRNKVRVFVKKQGINDFSFIRLAELQDPAQLEIEYK